MNVIKTIIEVCVVAMAVLSLISFILSILSALFVCYAKTHEIKEDGFLSCVIDLVDVFLVIAAASAFGLTVSLPVCAVFFLGRLA